MQWKIPQSTFLIQLQCLTWITLIFSTVAVKVKKATNFLTVKESKDENFIDEFSWILLRLWFVLYRCESEPQTPHLVKTFFGNDIISSSQDKSIAFIQEENNNLTSKVNQSLETPSGTSESPTSSNERSLTSPNTRSEVKYQSIIQWCWNQTIMTLF